MRNIVTSVRIDIRLSLFWAVLGITVCHLLEVQVRPEFFNFLLGEDNISEFFVFVFGFFFSVIGQQKN